MRRYMRRLQPGRMPRSVAAWGWYIGLQPTPNLPVDRAVAALETLRSVVAADALVAGVVACG